MRLHPMNRTQWYILRRTLTPPRDGTGMDIRNALLEQHWRNRKNGPTEALLSGSTLIEITADFQAASLSESDGADGSN